MQGLTRKTSWFTFLVILSIAIFSACGDEEAAIPDQVDFNYHIRPILVQKCYLCHGPDSGSRKAGLRLDTYEGATALTQEGLRAIDPGHADKSLLLFRINHKDPEMVMPTPESNLTLTDRERKLLERWIEQGAGWKPHWAFIPPKSSGLINGKGHPVDQFIEARLKEVGLKPGAIADQTALIRRVAMVLTGLPPTPAELDRYLNDTRDGSYERMVDRYLSSPRFGERWARHWMDVIRYAETRGHEFDYTISGAWRYRDYLIRAFNQDLPYDRFVTEQIAGDQLASPRLDPTGNWNESQLATLFHTLPEGTHSPVDIRKDEADRIDNMIDVTGKAFQALTISCARCHDHKFDPVSARDYYALYGVMEGTRFTPVPAAEPAQRRSAVAQRQVLDSMRALTLVWLSSKMGASATVAFASAPVSAPVMPDSASGILADFSGSDLQGWRSDGQAFTDGTTLGDPVTDSLGNLRGLKEGVASSRRLGLNLFGALRSPDFVIDRDFIGVMAAGQRSSVRIIIDNFQLIQFPIYGDLDQKLNSDQPVKLIFPVSAWKGHKAYIEVLPGRYEQHVYKQARDAWVEVEYAIRYDREWFEPRRPSSSVTLPAAFRALTAGQAGPADIRLLRGLLPRTLRLPELSALQARAQAVQSARMDSLQFISGVTEGFGKNSPVFHRGNHADPSPERVKRHFIPAIPVSKIDLDVPGSGRLALARAITDPKNPLTARIMVNRIWHHLFGRGLVETVDNFGMQGKVPSHPELLDQLAIDFMRDGWSVKRMIRHIMTSETFRRSVEPVSGAVRKDPGNILLASYPLRRMEAEAIRDAMLSVSGSLDTTMFGPPVRQHITSFMNGRGRPGKSGPIDGEGRRSIYLEVRRNFLDPFMMAFDRPMHASAFGRRTVTNVPAQSLILLNDPFVALMADRTAARLLAEAEKPAEARIRWIWLRCFSHPPTRKEISDATDFMETLKKTYARNGQTVSEQVIWKDYLHTVFNLKSFIFIS